MKLACVVAFFASVSTAMGAVQQSRTLLRQPAGTAAKCEPTTRCAEWGGKCTAKDDCLGSGENLRWVNGASGFCDAAAAPTTDSACGCCFEKPADMTDKELLDKINGFEVPVTRATLITADGLDMELDDNGDLVRVSATIDKTWTFLGGNGKSQCADGVCKIAVEGAAHNPSAGEGKQVEVSEGVFVEEMTPATLMVRYEHASTSGEEKKQTRTGVDVILELPEQAQSLEARFTASVHPYARLVEEAKIDRDIIIVDGGFHLQETKRSLCVQPVRLRHRTCTWSFLGICLRYSYSYSGAGLNFGRPGADLQWAKADLTFNWRPFVTVYDNSGKYKQVSSSEEADLRATYNDPLCIEVFFVPRFSPSDAHGGGATWSSGTASAKIISSDEMVSCGVDETHLAHELGHVVGLMHPGTGHATWADASTGTLLCGSGWERDNPRRNSRDNRNNLQNPLLTTSLGWYTAGHDCSASADCGSCAAHLPADAC